MICMYFVVFSLVIIINDSSVTDPCVDHKKLDDPDRSSSAMCVDHCFCDVTIPEAWYRAVSGSGQDMPTTFVPTGMCGTSYPIWINDSLPTNNEEKEVTICTTTFTSNCSYKGTIKVKNCGQFNVYYLIQTSGCPIRYCFGTESPCPKDTYSDTGFSPNCGVYPKIRLVLSVSAGLTNGSLASKNMIHKVIKFDCNLRDPPDEAKNYLFDVRWFIEDNIVADFNNKMLSELSNAYLPEDKWTPKYRMGFNVKCKMRAKFKNSTGVGPFNSSGFYYAGFEVLDSEIYVKEGMTAKIGVNLTVPVGCYQKQTDKCFINIRFTEPVSENCDGAVAFKNHGCGVRFTYENWNVTNYIEVTGKFDDLYGKNRNKHISLTVDHTIQHEAWSYATVPDILVHVSDEDVITKGKQCNIINDPYIMTFDRNVISNGTKTKYITDRKLLFNFGLIYKHEPLSKPEVKSGAPGGRYPNHRLGEFIIYKHDTHPTTVHGMFTACPGWWGSKTLTCICGIAIRNNDELFIANFCGTISDHYVTSSPTNRYIEKVSCDDEHMTVVSLGDKFTIYLTTGTTVEFTKGKFGPRGAQVYGITNAIIYPSVGDFEKTGGLCGYFDNKIQARDEFILRDKTREVNFDPFCEEWKLNTTKGDKSLFGDIVLQKSDVPLRSYCTCLHEKKSEDGKPDNRFNCELVEPFEVCPDNKISKDHAKSYFVKCGEGRPRRRRSFHNGKVKRSAEDDEYDDVFDRISLTYGPDIDRKPVEANWTNGWNQTSAKKHCSEKVETDTLINICKDVMKNSDQEVEMIIDQCSETIKVAGDTSFVESTLDALRMGCITEAKRDVNLTRTASRTGNASRSILDDLLDVSCPKNCSGNGVCTSGKCDCFNGFEGDICDLSRSIPPSISQTTNTGKCYMNKKRCTTYGISGSGFINEAVKCRAKHFQIYDDGQIVESSAVLTFDGVYINDISCYCTIPGSRRRRAASPATVIADGYYISVSNDGTTFSEEITFINYDSSCYDCNVTALNCSELAGASCIKPTIPDLNKDNEEPEDQPSIGIIVAVVVGVTAGILVVIILAMKLLGRKNTQEKYHKDTKVRTDFNARVFFNNADLLSRNANNMTIHSTNTRQDHDDINSSGAATQRNVNVHII